MKADVKVIRGDRYSVDVRKDTFIFRIEEDATITIQHADKGDKHILINIRRKNPNPNVRKGTSTEILNDKWLCGHDEREWFVASAMGTTIWQAKQSLKPKIVRELETEIKPKNRHKRKNEAFKRQGEWFFVRVPEGRISENVVTHKDEPISRGRGSKPHIVEEITRVGGRTVYVKGALMLEEMAYNTLDPDKQKGYRAMKADATVFGRGYVKHKDHATIYLEGWHEIFMNTEKLTVNLVFLD